MQTLETLEIGGFELSLQPMTVADIPRLHELSVSVSWPHRAEDWAMLLHLGRGWVARDPIGRVLGSAMWFPFGPQVASIGMVITSPRLQENGAGRQRLAALEEHGQELGPIADLLGRHVHPCRA